MPHCSMIYFTGNGFLVVDMLGNLLQLLKLENDPE